MVELTEKEMVAKSRVCLALDVPTVKDALNLAAELSDLVGMFKIGKELHTAAGNEAVNIVSEVRQRGGNVFLDLKLHDTPQTVGSASLQCAVPGVYMFDVHIAGGEKMCRKAVEAAHAGAQAYGMARPKVIGVTVLTSIDNGDLAMQHIDIRYDDLVARRAELAIKWGLDGIVCPAKNSGEMYRRFGPALSYVTPGIEWGGKKGEGQKQLYTPDRAVQGCPTSILVIGSAITKAQDRKGTAYEILQAMAKHL